MFYQALRGNTLSEYGIIFALLILVAIGGVKLLGNSINSRFISTSNTRYNQPMHDMAKMKFNSPIAGANSGPAGSFTGQNTQGNTNLPGNLLTGSSSGGTNATSVDGNTGTQVLMKSLSWIQKIKEIAEQQTDPSLKSKLLKLAYQGYYLSVAQAGYEYGQNATDNPLLKELAGLAETPGFDIVANPGISIRAIEHKTSQVGTKANDFLNDPAASPQDKQLIKQLAGQIYSLSKNRYGSKIEEFKTNNYDNYNKLPALSNTETGDDAAIRGAALHTLAANNGHSSDGTTFVQTTVKDSLDIENTANEQNR